MSKDSSQISSQKPARLGQRNQANRLSQPSKAKVQEIQKRTVDTGKGDKSPFRKAPLPTAPRDQTAASALNNSAQQERLPLVKKPSTISGSSRQRALSSNNLGGDAPTPTPKLNLRQ